MAAYNAALVGDISGDDRRVGSVGKNAAVFADKLDLRRCAGSIGGFLRPDPAVFV